jgi:flagellar motor switch protein FliN
MKEATSNLLKFDSQLMAQVEELLTKIFDTSCQISESETKPVNPTEVKAIIGGTAIRIDSALNGSSEGISYFALASHAKELTNYIDNGAENSDDVPESMQLLLDIAEQATQIKTNLTKELLNNDSSFANPSILLWKANQDDLPSEGVASYFNVSIAGRDPFKVVRIIPANILAKLFPEQIKEGQINKKEKTAVGPANGNGRNYSEKLPLEELYDLDLEISVELGRKKMMLKDILDLGVGGIVELDKFAGDAVELYVNNKKFAEGEVVVVEHHYAVRITNLVTERERFATVEE